MTHSRHYEIEPRVCACGRDWPHGGAPVDELAAPDTWRDEAVIHLHRAVNALGGHPCCRETQRAIESFLARPRA